ncbi:MAG: ABC transporter permease [Gemmatimonadetes bacterium]|nr:ABC transporter permease [Gemmatimonadota bacterium]
MWVRQALLIANKDFLLLLRDRWGFFFAMAFPIMFSAAFFFLFRNAGIQEETVHALVSTRETDPGALSRQIVDGLVQGRAGGIAFEEIPADEGLARAEAGEIPGMLLFPDNFTRAVLGEGRSEISVVAGSSPWAAAALRAVANDIAMRVSHDRAAVRAVMELSAASPAETAARVAGLLAGAPDAQEGTAEVRSTEVGDIEAWNPADFTIPGYLVMFVFFAAAFTAETVARERENRTLERLVTVGAGRAATLGGKFLKAVYQGAMQVTLLWLVGIFGFAVSLGDAPAATIIISALMVLVSAAFGVMLASFAKTVRAAAPLAVLVSLVAAPLGGCWWPLFIVPEWMQNLARFTPHGWANTAFNRLMLFGGDFGSVAYEMVALLGFGAAFAAVAVWRFRVVE